MILELKNIFKVEGSSLDFDYQMDLSGFAYEPNIFPFKKPVSVKGKALNHVGVVKLSATISYSFETQCDRCAIEICEESSLQMNSILVKELNDENNDDFILVQDDKFDLDEQVLDAVLLNLPTKHLCRQDCKGLCAQCGQNLNDGTCSCKTVNSGLDALKHFFDEPKE